MYREKLDAYIDAHKEEMLEDLKTLVRINSQRSESKEGKPFGEGAAEVLEAAEKLMKKYGLQTKNYENYVVTGDFNEEEKQLDILAHLDVVPVTEGWTVTKPFEPVVVDGRIYGRGTADDKGPAIAALYAMRAIKESGIELRKNVRVILGSDEECGSGDLEHYYAIETEAPMTFTPDADFPLINVEKGRLATKFTAKSEGETALPGIVEFHGGDKVNVVPAKAWAVVQGITMEDAKKAVEGLDEVEFVIEKEGEGIKIAAKGLAAHGASPELGKNAVSALLGMLKKLPLADSASKTALLGVEKLFPYGDHTGEALGIAMKDEIAGPLSINLGVLHFDGCTLYGELDSRTPACATEENVNEVIRRNMAEYGLILDPEASLEPIHAVPRESLLVQELLASYERYTGIKGEPLAIGGQTYVHELKNGVAFGCMVDGVDNHMHGDDEFMEVDVLMMSAKIFADAIVKLCGVK